MNGTITNALPDIPRLYTAICEWLACLIYLFAIYRKASIKRTILVLALGLPVMVAIQYGAGAMPKTFWILGMLLAAAGMYLIMLLGSNAGKRQALYLTARSFVLAELVASLHWQLATFIRYELGHESVLGIQRAHVSNLTANPESWFLLIATYAVCFSLAWLAERRNFSQSKPTLPTLTTTIATLAITVVTFAMSNLSFVSTNTPFSGTVGQSVFYIRTLVDFCGFTVLYAQQEQSRRIATNTELASIDAQLRSQHQEYLQSKENLESVGRISHDLKHQIAALRAEVDPEHAAAGFEQLEASVGKYSAQQHSGNPVLDVILTSKTRTCVSRGITLTAVADGKLLDSMTSMDIATLFGNALDNAIEAVSKLPDPQQRLVKLALFSQNRFTIIRVENYYASDLRSDGEGNLVTTKKDKHGHGFGVKSIRHIAELYGGGMTVHTENHWFTLTVMLPR
ncbi:ATP-binding protein [Bifidobacterium aemilianum]|uniref:ATP-binding protein n=1 Tax=Bifidobacterium aemilianum TaxID=2493120 RepID=A0A366K9D4_9BIFI|nr:ATP-binding protein [Bifidobacterium aemilianum]RBP97261.1 ATP-binding protein [Bifidobacterium aemilianum]